MPETHDSDGSSTAWPPREGRAFFFLWLGASIVGWVGSRVIWDAIGFSRGPSGSLDQRWLTWLPAVAVGVFHGWLLFSGSFRLGAWAALPLLHAVVPYFFRSNSTSAAFTTTMGLMSIVATIIGTLMLKGVRRRAWLWLFIQLGGLVVTQLTVAIFLRLFGFDQLGRIADWLNGVLRLPTVFALSGNSLILSITAGLWLATTVLSAWALAWWMPPLHRVASAPPLPGSQAQPLPHP